MKWNDVELIDGKFYVVEAKRWRNDQTNNWIFAYKDNNDFETNIYVCARITDTDSSVCSIYDDGYLCRSDRIVSLRPATREDMDYFWHCLSRVGYKYSLNTKKLRHVRC